MDNKKDTDANAPTQNGSPSAEAGPAPTGSEPHASPSEVIRAVFQESEIDFKEHDGAFECHLALVHMNVHLKAWAAADDVAIVMFHFPIRATPEFRAPRGEFLHRLNFCAKRKFWEMNYNDGAIHLAVYIDLIAGPLTIGLFRAALNCLVVNSDTVFPYLTSVLSGRMTPEFAPDQAEAAVIAQWQDDEEPETEN